MRSVASSKFLIKHQTTVVELHIDLKDGSHTVREEEGVDVGNHVSVNNFKLIYVKRTKTKFSLLHAIMYQVEEAHIINNIYSKLVS